MDFFFHFVRIVKRKVKNSTSIIKEKNIFYTLRMFQRVIPQAGK